MFYNGRTGLIRKGEDIVVTENRNGKAKEVDVEQEVITEREKRENIKKLAIYIGKKKNSEQITASLCELLSKIRVEEIH